MHSRQRSSTWRKPTKPPQGGFVFLELCYTQPNIGRLTLDIVACCEEWARWLAQRNFYGWPSKTVLGRCLDDMPTTKCTTCDGRGRLQGHEIGSSRAFLVCEVCKGKGKVSMSVSAAKINPALISGTERFDRLPRIQMNRVAHRIDLVVQNLSDLPKSVFYAEYTIPGPQTKKARLLNISQSKYSRTLKKNHQSIRLTFVA